MLVVTLGTASAYPTPGRGVSCTAVKHEDGNVWLFDCGEGSQIQLQRSCLKSGRVSKIFITHLHGDHLFGLPGLLCTMGIQLANKSSEGVHIFGPQGLRNYLRTSLSLSYSTLPFTYTVHELILNSDELTDDTFSNTMRLAEGPAHPQEIIGQDLVAVESIWNVYEDEKVIVQAGSIKHTVPCVGYVLAEKERKGKLDVKRLKELGIPQGPIYGQIKRGKSVCLPDGSTLSAGDLIGPPRKGCKITILGDTSNPYNMAEIAKDSDVLFHEATFLSDMKDKALEYGHSTPSMAAQFAMDIGVKKLVLFHYSHRYKAVNEETKDKSNHLKYLLQEAEETLSSRNISSCVVVLAEDLMKFSIS